MSVTGVSETRASRSTSLVTMANRKLADSPHISTPMMLPPELKVRRTAGERHHHSRRSHNRQPRSKRGIPIMENKASDRTPPNRLYQITHPSRSQYKIFNRSVRRLQKTSRCPEKGLQWIICSAIIDNPSKERRMAHSTVHSRPQSPPENSASLSISPTPWLREPLSRSLPGLPG